MPSVEEIIEAVEDIQLTVGIVSPLGNETTRGVYVLPPDLNQKIEDYTWVNTASHQPEDYNENASHVVVDIEMTFFVGVAASELNRKWSEAHAFVEAAKAAFRLPRNMGLAGVDSTQLQGSSVSLTNVEGIDYVSGVISLRCNYRELYRR